MDKKKKNPWCQIGYVGVDSGKIAIVDPCYSKDKHFQMALKEEIFIDKFTQISFPNGSDCAVVFSTVIGDGVFPVYAKKTKNGIEIKICGRF